MPGGDDGPLAIIGCARLGVSGKPVESSAGPERIGRRRQLCLNPAYRGRGRLGIYIPTTCGSPSRLRRLKAFSVDVPRQAVRGYRLVIWGTVPPSARRLVARHRGGQATGAVLRVDPGLARRIGAPLPFSAFVVELPVAPPAIRSSCGPPAPREPRGHASPRARSCAERDPVRRCTFGRMQPAVVLAVLGALLAPAPARAAPPVVDCASRAEPSPPRPDGERWIVAGPVAWPRLRADVFSRHRATGSISVKRGVSVAAGQTVTVRVVTRGAALINRQSTRLAERPRDADRALRFRPCAPETPRFSGAGAVGPRTGFAGALIADRRTCVRIRVSAGGRRWHARIPVGRRCR